jgi:hypothetical protein
MMEGRLVTISLRLPDGFPVKGGTYTFGKMFSMRKLAAFFFVVILSAVAGRLQAQSLQHTAWKFYLGALHDTLTLHIGGDSSYTTTSSGETVVRSSCKIVKDTIKLRDVAGEYYCPDGEGVYRFAVEGDYLGFFLVTDPCSNRSDSINGTKWRKTDEK